MLASAAPSRMRIEIPNLEAGQCSRRERERVSLSGMSPAAVQRRHPCRLAPATPSRGQFLLGA